MRRSQTNKLNMFETVIGYLNVNADTVNTVAQFTLSFEDFKTAVEAIKIKEQERQTVTSGKTDAKYNAEEELLDHAASVASGLFTYARKTDKIDIKNIADITSGKLAKLKDQDLLNRCKQIFDAAKIFEVELAPFGVTAKMLTSLQLIIPEFENSIKEREAAAATRVGAGSTIVELFNNADEILEEELDRFTENLKSANSPFFDGYQAARVIKDIGIRHDPEEEEPAG